MTLPTSNQGKQGQRSAAGRSRDTSRLDALQAEMMAGMQGKDTAPHSVAPSLSVNNRPTLSLDGEFHGRIAYESEPVFAGSISYEELVEEQNSNQARIVDEAEAVAEEHLAHAVRTRAPAVAKVISEEKAKTAGRGFWLGIVAVIVLAAALLTGFVVLTDAISEPVTIQQQSSTDFLPPTK